AGNTLRGEIASLKTQSDAEQELSRQLQEEINNMAVAIVERDTLVTQLQTKVSNFEANIASSAQERANLVSSLQEES
ncbi:unnamed protein product, partial [Chrysoparadoxa australica]